MNDRMNLTDLVRKAADLTEATNELREKGQHERTYEAAREATEYYRTLARSCPEVFLPDLVMSLIILGHILSELGRREEAFDAAREENEIRERLKQVSTATQSPINHDLMLH